jgi:PAS domain S-box-containing protein
VFIYYKHLAFIIDSGKIIIAMKISSNNTLQSAHDVFTELIRAKPEYLNETLEKALITFCQFAKAEHCALYNYFEENNSVIMTHQWPVVPSDESDVFQKTVTSRPFAPFLKELISGKSTINRQAIVQVAETNSSLFMLERTFAFFPLSSEKGFHTFLGLFGKNGQQHELSEGLDDFFNIIRDAFLNAVMRLQFSSCILNSKRNVTEDALRLRESYLTAIIENQPGLVWLKDKEGRFLAVNHAFARSCGKQSPDELIGKTDLDIWPRELAEMYRNDDESVIASGSPVNVEEIINDNGERRWFETFKTPVKNSSGEIIGTSGYAHDITTLKLEEEALSNVQKLESLGILAGGIAHDFNNLLGGIFGFIDLAAMITNEPDVAELLNDSLLTIDRARGLTQQLLTFAKGGTPVKKIESLVSLLQETAKFALSGSQIKCEFYIAPNLWLCKCDRNQIGQVVDNILINAHQAMPNGGTVIIGAENVIIEGMQDKPTLKAGKYVKVSIRDQGVGIPKEIITRIFDPFFTTKKKGHGLGLSTCYSIIHRHEGFIEAESEIGTGTTVRFFIPATSETVQEERNVESTISEKCGTVIFMDDEESIRKAVSHMLKTIGYAVIVTQNGLEAIERLKAEIHNGRQVTAVILDLTVPGGMGGLETVVIIRELCPDLPVFVSSGYADSPVMAKPKEYGFTDSICKPFRIVDMSTMLQRNKI